MKRFLFLLACLTFIIPSFYYCSTVIPQIIDIQSNSELFNKLKLRAKENLQNLPKDKKKAYIKLLKHADNLVVPFVLGYELSGKLAAANPQDIASHCDNVVRLAASEQISCKPEFFLSYIAKLSVADERITNYRVVMEDMGLRQIREKYSDPMERYRQVCLWCQEYLMYKATSGRDQSPLSIIKKSYIGRCEESQILFVSACRTVGIPARPASVVWWAHQNDNHAWAEVNFNGHWYYTGDMDAGYYTNQTWFSGLVDKTVMILADGVLDTGNEEVLTQDIYDATINSTVNYCGEHSRRIDLYFFDEQGELVPNCDFNVMVYNFQSLRSIIQMQADSTGASIFTVGRGAFFISAFKGDLKALQYIPSSEDSVMNIWISMSTQHLPQQEYLMEYPSNQVNWKPYPQEWTEALKEAQARWKLHVDTAEAIETSIPNAEADTLFLKVWKLCRNNKAQFEAFAIRYYPLDKEYLNFLLDYEEKLLWESSTEQFIGYYNWFLTIKPYLAKYNKAEQEILLAPTLFYEDLSMPYKNHKLNKGFSLYSDRFQHFDKSKVQLEDVIKYFNRKYQVNNKKALYGLLPMDVAVRQKYLTNYQYRLLGAQFIKANGIPADYTRINNVVNVYLNGRWVYYDLSTNKPANLQKSGEQSVISNFKLKCTDEAGIPLFLSKDQLTMTVYRSGSFYPTNEQFDYLGDGVYSISVPQGVYYAQIGYRVNSDLTGFDFIPFTENQDTADTLLCQLPDFPRRWNAVEKFLVPITCMLDSLNLSYALVGNYSHENSRRMATKLMDANKNFVWFGYEPAEMEGFDYRYSELWQQLCKDNPSLISRTFTLIKSPKDGSWQMWEGLWEQLP